EEGEEPVKLAKMDLSNFLTSRAVRFTKLFTEGQPVNKYIERICNRYSEESFADEQRRRYLVAHMDMDDACYLASYLIDLGIEIKQSTFKECIDALRDLYETETEREERERAENPSLNESIEEPEEEETEEIVEEPKPKDIYEFDFEQREREHANIIDLAYHNTKQVVDDSIYRGGKWAGKITPEAEVDVVKKFKKFKNKSLGDDNKTNEEMNGLTESTENTLQKKKKKKKKKKVVNENEENKNDNRFDENNEENNKMMKEAEEAAQNSFKNILEISSKRSNEVTNNSQSATKDEDVPFKDKLILSTKQTRQFWNSREKTSEEDILWKKRKGKPIFNR
ncbi:unnamed protein product, partial [Meganyctiphanes norvegica]